MASAKVDQRERAMELLLAGNTPPQVAGAIGVNRSTVWRWTQEPDFAAELRQRRAERKFAILEMLEEGALEAVGCLRAIQGDAAAPVGVRVRAACALLDRAGMDARGSSLYPNSGLRVEGVESWPEREAALQEDKAHRGLLRGLIGPLCS